VRLAVGLAAVQADLVQLDVKLQLEMALRRADSRRRPGRAATASVRAAGTGVVVPRRHVAFRVRGQSGRPGG